jgi:fructose-1,6-bisphosphatase/inositol monophosphatase family enzyme
MPWDHMPGLALATELGFVFEKQNGESYLPDKGIAPAWNGGLIVAPNKELLSQIQNLLFK